MKSWIKELDISALNSNFMNSGKSFMMFPINSCFTSTMDELETHVSFLKAGTSPHEPHSHSEEELIVVLSGKLQIRRLTQSKEIIKSTPFSPGSFIYHDSNRAHTVYSVGPEPAIYVCIKWIGIKIGKKMKTLTSSDFVPDYAEERKNFDSEFSTKVVFESPTEFLGKLHAHISHMKPGAGYKPHSDPYDAMIILLHGKIETLEKEAKSKSIVFYQAGELHGIKNFGFEIARYIVFEFHGKSYNLSTKKHINRILKIILRKLVPRKIHALVKVEIFKAR